MTTRFIAARPRDAGSAVAASQRNPPIPNAGLGKMMAFTMIEVPHRDYNRVVGADMAAGSPTGFVGGAPEGAQDAHGANVRFEVR